jgi:hypothetical protein
MNARLVGLLAIVSVVGIAPAHAATYTLDYTGDAYTQTNCTPDCGTNLTASVSINFDPDTYSGQVLFNSTSVVSASITSGDYTASIALGTIVVGGSSLTFTDGVITSWFLYSVEPLTASIHGLSSQFSGGGTLSAFGQDEAEDITGQLSVVESNPGPPQGSWSPATLATTPLPGTAPLFLTAIAGLGLLFRRGKRKAQAATA